LADLRATLEYIAEHSSQGAARVQRRLKAIIDLIAERPAIGARTDHPSVRRMPVSPYPYLVFYEVSEDAVVIHAIRHGARAPGTWPAR
jgi:plasmid stabilization system protein ParE